MKTINYFRTNVLRTLILLTLATGCSRMVYGQSWSNGRYMRQAINETMTKAVILESSTSVGFDDGVCFLGAVLRTGNEVGWVTTLQAGCEYVFIGGGDEDANDVDITVSTTGGTLLARDTQTDKTPIVRFTPRYTGQYTIKLKLYQGDDNSFCCMAILKEGGNRVPTGNLDDVVGKIIKYGTRINTQEGGAKFLDLTNQWCMYGTILGEGNRTEITNINLGYQNHAILASGDNNANDLDLYLLRNGYEIARDIDADSVPNIVEETTGANYAIKLRNQDSDGKTFAMFCILTI